MSTVICPGIHAESLTDSFLTNLSWQSKNLLILPVQKYPPYSPLHVLEFLQQQVENTTLDLRKSSLVFIGFSAGVVGAIGGAKIWQQKGGRVKALIALDGWGVPLYGNFPTHRISHDSFTHQSSTLLENGEDNFYADPPVSHLDLWRSPQTAQGWRIYKNSQRPFWREERSPMTAAQFLSSLLNHYTKGNDNNKP